MLPYTIVKIIDTVFNILELAILLECIMSWMPQARNNKFMNIVSSFTYPILEPFRKLQDRFIQGLPVDLSPIIALFAINIIRRLIIGIIL